MCVEECLVAAPHAGLSAAAVSPPWPHSAQLPGPGGAVQLCSRAAPHLLMNINTTHQHSFSSSDMTTQANNAALFTLFSVTIYTLTDIILQSILYAFDDYR